jgi:hypothetical protein
MIIGRRRRRRPPVSPGTPPMLRPARGRWRSSGPRADSGAPQRELCGQLPCPPLPCR